MKTVFTELKKGDVRIKTRFLLLPLTIDLERRWLERATWEEVLTWYCGDDAGLYWVPSKWLDNV